MEMILVKLNDKQLLMDIYLKEHGRPNLMLLIAEDDYFKWHFPIIPPLSIQPSYIQESYLFQL
jgi:hypothetical protein